MPVSSIEDAPAARELNISGKLTDIDVRHLWASDQGLLLAHFLRLDPETRRLRFGNFVNDTFLEKYVAGLFEPQTVVFGAFVEGKLVGVGEVRGLPGVFHFPGARSGNAEAEAAFSVERPWQDMGVGTRLLTRMVAAAQNRGVDHLFMVCLRENRKMQHLAARHDAIVKVDTEDADAHIYPSWPTPSSIIEELAGEAAAYTHDLMRRLMVRG